MKSNSRDALTGASSHQPGSGMVIATAFAAGARKASRVRLASFSGARWLVTGLLLLVAIAPGRAGLIVASSRAPLAPASENPAVLGPDSANKLQGHGIRREGRLAFPEGASRQLFPEPQGGARCSLRAVQPVFQPRRAPSDAFSRHRFMAALRDAEIVEPSYERRELEGWSVRIRRELLADEARLTERALELLRKQLLEIVQVVPSSAVKELRRVPLYFSPEYPGRKPTAEFHPDAGWLRANGRDPAMAKAVEFSNVRQFEAEMDRMPNFVLHELAHAYHNRVLPEGFANPELEAAYERAKASGKYDRVERRFGNSRPNTFERAYAMNDAMEYFAETSEAFFSRNDFFPFNRDELKAHDPEMFALLPRLWGVAAKADAPRPGERRTTPGLPPSEQSSRKPL